MRDSESFFRAYGDLAVRVGLNLQPGQRLLVIGPLASGGVSLEAAPLVRAIVRSAYKAGAPYVETLWGDEALQLVRFRHAPSDSFEAFSRWLPDALVQHARAGDALISIYANDPDLLKNEDPEQASIVQRATARATSPFRGLISRNETNWTVVAAAGRGWAAKMFPDRSEPEQMAALWKAIGQMCRLDASDPIGAWETHLAALATRRDTLNHARFDALRYRGPGTDLTIGLAAHHQWVSGRSATRGGQPFTPNLPTEEVFTLPNKDRVDGVVRSTKPLSYAGTLIEGFALRFAAGRVVDFSADTGETVLRRLVETDEGAARLGEIALVPNSSPIAKAGVLFYNTLFDENAASHVALGAGYRFTVAGGEAMSEEEFARAGGNLSATHVDFMIGSHQLDIDGLRADGSVQPVMRRGEWALPV